MVMRSPWMASMTKFSEAVQPDEGTEPDPSSRKAMSSRASHSTRVGKNVGDVVGDAVVGLCVYEVSIFMLTSSISMHPQAVVCEANSIVMELPYAMADPVYVSHPRFAHDQLEFCCTDRTVCSWVAWP